MTSEFPRDREFLSDYLKTLRESRPASMDAETWSAVFRELAEGCLPLELRGAARKVDAAAWAIVNSTTLRRWAFALARGVDWRETTIPLESESRWVYVDARAPTVAIGTHDEVRQAYDTTAGPAVLALVRRERLETPNQLGDTEPSVLSLKEL